MLLRRLAGFYMPGGDFSSFEARYSFFCLGCVVHILDIFFFLFRYFLLGSAYSRVFSLACLIFYFSQQLYCYWFFFFVILCRICRRLPPGVICVVPVDTYGTAIVIFKS